MGAEKQIWAAPSWLERYARGQREFIHCNSSDGVKPVAILVLPLNHDPKRQYPLVVDLHGGPGGGLTSSRLAYNSAAITGLSTLEHDLWAAKGYAVLAADYRSSGLYGYEKSSRDGHAYAQDFEDIMCNVDAVIAKGVADPNRMAVIGHSAGAMEVNWIVTHTGRFAAAVSKEGVWNINTGYSWASEGRPNRHYTLQYGTPIEHPDRYRRMSIMDHVRGVTTPTMFVENKSGNRPGVSYDWMFAAWQAQGVKAQRRIYEEQKHSLTQRADQRDLLEAVIRWFDENLALGKPGDRR